jgi:ribose 5-phosphate isomerase B|tara:strand:+ start:21 stop:467 length:447 start_codon:yes stop_codon:yes gene_type:complete
VKKINKIKQYGILIASDHAGYKLKETVKKHFLKKEKPLIDLGTHDESSVDYPHYAHLLARRIRKKDQFGILICGSGTGMNITVNKHKNVRAALCYNIKSTQLSRLHNNANVISIGARLTKKNVALKCIDTFIKTKFKGGRHLRRVNKI